MSKLNFLDFYKKCLKLGLKKNVFIAYSGGIDSSLLLHLSHISLINKNYYIRAIHINHLFNKNSIKHSIFCKKICDKLKIPIYILSINFTFFKKKNLEEFFRIERYTLLFKNIPSYSSIIMGHNKNDLIENFFLRLFRGSNLPGLSNLKINSKIKNINIIRPILNINRFDINRYCRINNIIYIIDVSNNDNRFYRNYLRNNIIPLLSYKWKNFYKSIYRYGNICYFNNIFFFKMIFLKYKMLYKLKYSFVSIKYLLSLPIFVRYEFIKLWINDKNYGLSLSIHIKEINKILESKNYFFSKFKFNEFNIIRDKNFLYIDKITTINNNIKFKFKCNKIYKNINNKIVFSYFSNNNGIKCEFKEFIYLLNYCDNFIKKIFKKYNIHDTIKSNYPIIFENNNLIMIFGLWLNKKYCTNSLNKPGLIIKIL